MEELSLSREQSETRLRQDIEEAWEPYFERTSINRTQFARRMRYAIEPVLIAEYKSAALALLQRFLKPEDIDLDELDELADTDMQKWCIELGGMLAEVTGKWIEDDENPGRAFSRERAELIAITEITRARTQGEMAAAAILEELDILLDARWFTMEDEMVCSICGPLHKTPEKFWREILPNGTPAHPRCRCRLDWKEKKRRPKLIGRIRRAARGTAPEEPETPGRSSVQRFSRVRRPARMQTRRRETVEDFEVLRSSTRFFEAVAVTGPTVGGLAIVARDTGRVLMLQRSMSDEDDPARGKWEFPGGHLEDGEEAFQAACREWSEEVGQPCPVSDFAGHWDSGIYRGHVAVVDSESVVPMMDDRKVLNPDDPDQDLVEVVAWWNPYDLKNNPAIREELNDAIDDVVETIAVCCQASKAIRESEEVKDGDGDGLVFDGKPEERPATKKELASVYPRFRGGSIDGLSVLKNIDNTSSIESSLNDYETMPGVRIVDVSKWPIQGGYKGYGYVSSSDVDKVDKLIKKIESSGKISPLIIVVDKDGPYVLEGGHRYSALRAMGKTKIPAMVVIDRESIPDETLTESEADPRDGDGDGLVDDGKQSERPAVKRTIRKGPVSGPRRLSVSSFIDRARKRSRVNSASLEDHCQHFAAALSDDLTRGGVPHEVMAMEAKGEPVFHTFVKVRNEFIDGSGSYKSVDDLLRNFASENDIDFDEGWEPSTDGLDLSGAREYLGLDRKQESELDPRDGDGDGVIDDGKSSERPANKRPSKRKTVGLTTKSLEDEIANDSVEHLIVIGADGKAYRSTGNLDSVQMTDEQRQHVKGGTILHNHPEESSFSPEDLFSFNNSGAKSMVLVDPVSRYELSMNGSMSPATWNLSVRKDIGSLVKAEQKRKTASELLWHNVNTKLAKKYGWKYSRVSRDSS